MSDSVDRGADEQRGEVLDMLRTLITDGRNEDAQVEVGLHLVSDGSHGVLPWWQ